jgi:hypothetical protein
VFSLRAETTLLPDATVGICPVCGSMEVSLFREGRDHELSQMALGPSRRDPIARSERTKRRRPEGGPRS